MTTQSNVERFYEWMKAINNKFLYDNDKMVNAFNIVALCDVKDIKVVDFPLTSRGYQTRPIYHSMFGSEARLLLYSRLFY